MRGAVPQRRRQHGQLVFVGQQRCRVRRGAHPATVSARDDEPDQMCVGVHRYSWNMVTPARTRPGTREEVDATVVDSTETPWITIVWDDPVNLMTYVTYILQKLFGYS